MRRYGDHGSTARGWAGMLCALAMCGAFSLSAAPLGAQNAPIHGLWVWKGPSVLEAPGSAERLQKFCQDEGINEVYLSIFSRGEEMPEGGMTQAIGVLHESKIRVEALLSSDDADERGKHRDKLLAEVRAIIGFNKKHSTDRFDGIHLDIEPQQRSENKGAGNLRFLPGLVEAYRAVLVLADAADLTVNADIQDKLLKGDLAQRKMLMTSLPRLTLMLYELSSPADGESVEAKTEKLRAASGKFLEMAYEGLGEPHLAKMMIGLRTPDYGNLLPMMLKSLDEANGANPHYAGWARHSYNDKLPSAR
jgi:hypothetical protein